MPLFPSAYFSKFQFFSRIMLHQLSSVKQLRSGDKDAYRMPPNETLNEDLKTGVLGQDNVTSTLIFFVNGKLDFLFVYT